MAIHTFEADIKTQLVQTLSLEESTDAWPHVGLAPSTSFDIKTFSLVRLENEWITVVLCPALGGRILQITPKGSPGGLELPKQLNVLEGGTRGARCPEGIQWFAGRPDGASSMGLREMSLLDDDEAPAVLFHDFDASSHLSTYVKLELVPDSAMVRVSFRCTNRGLKDIPFSAGVTVPPVFGEPSERFLAGGAYRDPRSGGGVGVCGEQGVVVAIEPDQALVWRSDDGPLRAHEVFSCAFELFPFQSELPVVSVGRGMIIGSDQSRLEVSSATGQPEAIVLIRDAHGDPFEARAAIGPGSAFSSALAGSLASPTELAVRTSTDFLASTRHHAVPLPPAHGDPAMELTGVPGTWNLPTLHHLAKGRDLGAVARYALAANAASNGNWDEADGHLVEAINLNAECELLWWFRAAIARNRGSEAQEEDANLLNAHYLSPMDPLLRAEAFLGLGMSLSAEPNPMLSALHEFPDKVVEVACHYIRSGLYTDASRWIDESLRHAESYRLRVLQCWLLATRTRMEVEAMQHLAKIDIDAVGAPLPSDPVELLALMQLCERFPQQQALILLARYL